MSQVKKTKIQFVASEIELQQFSATIDVSILFLCHQNKVLFLQTAKPKEVIGGTWGVPGGKHEQMETPSGAAIRELYEETGIHIKHEEVKFLGFYYARVSGKENVDVRLSVFRSDIASDKPVKIKLNSLEHKAYKWVALDQINALDLIAGEKDIIRHFWKQLI